jgi:hypothetical protein
VPTGAAYELLAFHFNLGHFGNALTIWLGMRPAQVFFFIFLPPLLLDSAVRVDYFLFRKVRPTCCCTAQPHQAASSVLMAGSAQQSRPANTQLRSAGRGSTLAALI